MHPFCSSGKYKKYIADVESRDGGVSLSPEDDCLSSFDKFAEEIGSWKSSLEHVINTESFNKVFEFVREEYN